MATTKLSAEKLALLPPAKWRAAYENQDRDGRYDIEQAAASLAVHYMRLARYFETRQQGATHEQAVRAQNTGARRARRALGYTYPDDPVVF